MQLSALQTQVLEEIGITSWVMREKLEQQISDKPVATLSTIENIDVGEFAIVLPQTELSSTEQKLLNQILFSLQLGERPVLLSVEQYRKQHFSETTVLFVFDSLLAKEQGLGKNGQTIFNPSLTEILSNPHLKAGVWHWLKHYKTA